MTAAKHPAGWYWFPESSQRHWLEASEGDGRQRTSACGCWHAYSGEERVRLAEKQHEDQRFNCWLCRHELQIRKEGRLHSFEEIGLRVTIAVSDRSGIRELNGRTGSVARIHEDGRASIRMDEPFQWPKAMGGDDRTCQTIRLYARQCVRADSEAAKQ